MRLRSPDKGWAWVSLGAAACCSFFAIGILRSSAVLFLAFRTKFEIPREQAAWPSTIRKITGAFAGLFIGILSHFISLKKLAFSGIAISVIGLGGCYFATSILIVSLQFGILLGLGAGMLSSTNVIIVNRYFKKYRTVALGILYSSTAASGFFYPILVSYLLDVYELQGCFLLMCGVLMQAFVAISLYKNPPHVEESKNDSTVENFQKKLARVLQSFLKLFRTAMFHVIWITIALYSVTYVIYLTVLIDYAVDCGIQRQSAVFILSSLSITEFCGRLSCGWLIDLGWFKRRTVMILAFLMKALMYATIPMWNTYIGFLFTSFFIGFAASCLTVNVSALYTDYLGLSNLPLGLGTGKALNGFLHFASPSIVGYFRDIRGSYDLMFFYFGGAYVLASFLWLLEPLIIKNKKKEKLPEIEEWTYL